VSLFGAVLLAADASAIAGSCPITAVLVIPPKANRRQPIACDFHMYRWRHLVENVFCCLKAFRRIATRYDKTDESFAAVIPLVGSAIALR
jgi:transposase